MLIPDSKVAAQDGVGEDDLRQRRIFFGSKLGLGVPVYRGTEVESAYAHFGLNAGLHLRYQLTPRLSVQPEFFYNRKSASAIYSETSAGDTVIRLGDDLLIEDDFIQDVRNDVRLDFDYLELPLLFRYDIIKNRDYKMFVIGGPVMSYIAGSRISGRTQVFVSDFNAVEFLEGMVFQVYDEPVEPDVLSFHRIDYGFMIGGGTNYELGLGRLTFDIRFTLGTRDIERSEGVIMRSGNFAMLFGFEF